MWLAVLFAACDLGPECSGPGAELASAGGEALTCGDGDDVVDWIELLAGRPLSNGDRKVVLGSVAERFVADPAGTRAWLARIREEGERLGALSGAPAGAARAARVWRSQRGDDLVGKDDPLWNLQLRAMSVWAKDDGEELALTESDLEAWIRYASLCREAQGAGVLRLSVADRVTVYQMLIDRFEAGDPALQHALASLGGVWQDVIDRWQAASYEQQQAWIAAAPLPPPMTATSLAYAGAVFDTDLVRHADVLASTLGPFRLADAEAFDP